MGFMTLFGYRFFAEGEGQSWQEAFDKFDGIVKNGNT